MKYIGTVTVPAGTSRDNTTTAVPFSIQGFNALQLVSDSNVNARTDTGENVATANDLEVAAGGGGGPSSAFEVPPYDDAVISVYNPNGVVANVKVYGMLKTLWG